MDVVFLSDGSSDKLILPSVRWLLGDIDSTRRYDITVVDLGRIPNPPSSLAGRMELIFERGRWDLVLVHRDVERETRAKRVEEIGSALASLAPKAPAKGYPTTVPVIPVRMTEAWLLFDEKAIRRAAGRVKSAEPLELPGLASVESHPDPKKVLHEALRRASGKSGRHLRKFSPEERCYRLVDYIGDWSKLDALDSFKFLRADLSAALKRV